ncbi:hypothetical protein [Roseateles sp. PN1]|uniref:hypothetical protein n=1 Tax=Roseateles sp. PN1 TaxID=3137372 RepID=UPI0031394A41
MSILRVLIVALAFVVSGVAATPEIEDAEVATELVRALQGHMISTFACQNFLGGLGRYRAAKRLAVETHVSLTNDRNAAVLAVAKFEKQIKATKSNERMVEKFKKMNLSYLDSVGTCEDLTAQTYGEVEVLQARLGLL